jgi:hypothetical protein
MLVAESEKSPQKCYILTVQYTVAPLSTTCFIIKPIYILATQYIDVFPAILITKNDMFV